MVLYFQQQQQQLNRIKKILMPLILLIIFTGFTAYSMLNSQESLIGFATRLMSSLDTAQVGIDLNIPHTYFIHTLCILNAFSMP
jgi:hypothetical protein